MSFCSLKKNILILGFFIGNLAYASFSKGELDTRNSLIIRESGYGYARKAAYEPSRFFQNFEGYGENGDISLGEIGEYSYSSRGFTGGTFARTWRNWVLGLGYGYIESQGKFSGRGKRDLETFGTNIYFTQRSEEWSFILSGGYAEGKNKINLFGDRYSYKSEVYSLGLELNSRYEHRKNYNIYPYIGFDYSWEKQKKHEAKKYESPLGKVGLILEERHGLWLYSLDLAWLHNFGEKDSTQNEKGTGYFRYSVEKEIGKSMVWGVYYGGYLVEDDYLHRYGMTIRYNW